MDEQLENLELDGGTVVLDVPAEPKSLRLLRLAAADAAATAGFDLDRVETARLVIDELASVLIGHGEGRLSIRITRAADRLTFAGSLHHAADPVVEVDFIVKELLDASLGPGRWDVSELDGAAAFRAEVPRRREPG